MTRSSNFSNWTYLSNLSRILLFHQKSRWSFGGQNSLKFSGQVWRDQFRGPSLYGRRETAADQHLIFFSNWCHFNVANTQKRLQVFIINRIFSKNINLGRNIFKTLSMIHIRLRSLSFCLIFGKVRLLYMGKCRRQGRHDCNICCGKSLRSTLLA